MLSAKRIVGRREIAQEAAHLDRRIADYLTGLDESDDDEPNEAPSATAAALQVLSANYPDQRFTLRNGILPIIQLTIAA